MISALTGVGRPVDARAGTGVEASRIVSTARAAMPAMIRLVVPRPDGYVAPPPLILDLTLAQAVAQRVAPENRRL